MTEPRLGSGALRGALGRAASERHLAWAANGNPTCESYSFVACPYMPCKRDRELALSLSSPIEPPPLSPEEVAGIRQGLADVAAGRTKPIEQIREEMRARPTPQASSEVREHIYDHDVESTGRSVNHSDNCWCVAPSRQGAGGK